MNDKYYWALAAAMMALPAGVSAQDTYVNEQMTSVTDLNGTARYVGMGGALGALGADMSVISSNPAGIGLFRKNDLAGTFGVMTQADKSSPNDFFTHTSLDQLGFVFSSPFRGRVLKYLNFAANYQKKINYDHSLVADNANTNGLSQTQQLADLSNVYGSWGDDDDFYFPSDLATTAYDGFLLNQTQDGVFYGQSAQGNQFTRVTQGSLQSYDFNISANLKDRFYVGFTLGVDHVDYYSESFYTELLEQDGLYYDYNAFSQQTTTGYGINAKFGVIVRPIENSAFRIGLAVETPTYYTLETVADMYMDTHYDSKGNYDANNLYRYYGPEDNYLNYTVSTPWKVRVSLGHTIGDFFAIGAEYEYVNYSKTRMGYIDYDSWGGAREDAAMNDHTQANLKAGHNFKVGMEFKLMKNLYGRIGYNYYATAYTKQSRMNQNLDSYALVYNTYTDYMNKSDVNLYTIGLGYKWKHCYLDLVYKMRSQSADFYAFDDSYVYYQDNAGAPNAQLDPVHVNLNRHQVAMTLGFKF